MKMFSFVKKVFVLGFIYLFILFSLYLTLTKYRKQKNTCLQ